MSRVPGIIILSLLLLGFCGSPSRGQAKYELLNLTKKEYKVLRKEVNKMSSGALVRAFLVESKPNLVVAKLDTIANIGQYPLPSQGTLDIAAMTYPDLLADLLNAHYFIGLDSLEHEAFYGLDTIGRQFEVKAYSTISSLPQAILKHDYLLSGSQNLALWASQEKLSGKFRKELRLKVIDQLAKNISLPKINSAIDPETEYLPWAIQVYASNKALHASKHTPPMTTEKVNLPDDNWLSKLIAPQIAMGVFNPEGERIKLAQGVPELFAFKTSMWYSIDTLIAGAIRQEAMPGCQLLVAKDGFIVLNKAYGYQTYDSLKAVSHETIYDLASMTKVLATTQALMLLYDEGKFDPAEKLSNYLPYLKGTNKDNITGTAVLSHQADLYLYYPFWKRAAEAFELTKMNNEKKVGTNLRIESWVADSISRWAAESDLLSERVDSITRSQYFYSDVGFFFLKDLIEKQTRTTLDRFLAEELYKPNGLELVFNPLNEFPDSLIAPTENDRLLRNELLRGYVHDRNAALLGGVAGQAGLFGNAEEIAELMQIHLDRGRYLDQQVFKESTVDEFTRRHYASNRRGLGWDMPALPAGRPGPEPDGPVSAYASDDTFGHTGFTGGMVWADPKENLIFVFLSNRVYPSADNNKLVEMNIRTRIQDIIYRSLGYK